VSIEVICDGCGKREVVERFSKPREWYSREDEDGVQLACSRPCIDATARRSDKTRVILPL